MSLTNRSSVLLVVAPKRRIEPLWKEMMDLVRASGDFAVGEEAVSESLIGAPVSECSTLMLVSWEHLLLQLAMRAEENSDRDTLRSIAELQGVVEYEALNAFQAPSKDLAELDEKNRERFKQLIDGAIAEGRGECWASTDGYGPGGGVTGYIRYFATGEVPMWFGYDMRLWERYGGPLWVGFQDIAQNNIGVVRDGLRGLCGKRPKDFYRDVPSWSQKRDYIRIELRCSGEYPEVLEALMVQLREIAGALKDVRIPRHDNPD